MKKDDNKDNVVKFTPPVTHVTAENGTTLKDDSIFLKELNDRVRGVMPINIIGGFRSKKAFELLYQGFEEEVIELKQYELILQNKINLQLDVSFHTTNLEKTSKNILMINLILKELKPALGLSNERFKLEGSMFIKSIIMQIGVDK
jgi:hypothetical protein